MLPDHRIEMVGVEINIQRNHIQTRKFASLRIDEICLAVDVLMVDDYGGFGQSCNRPEPYREIIDFQFMTGRFNDTNAEPPKRKGKG